jgi:phosphoribosylformylglycinamidine synthase subunit PurL
VKPLTDEAPQYERPTRAPDWLAALQAFDPLSLPAPKDLGEALLALLARPTIASKEWVIGQYDHTVRLGAVVRAGKGDAAVVRVERSEKGLAMSVDCNQRFVFLDPYEGARLAVAECTRNVACGGGEPLGLTDCLNFGNPEKPDIMWQFAEATRGLSAACRELDVPVVSGNVSLYNETDGVAILPTPTVAVVGLLRDVTKTVGLAFRRAGDLVAILGETRGELGGSEWLLAFHDKLAGRPPRLDVVREKSLQQVVRGLIGASALSSAHDTSEGGLAVALAECCVADKEAMFGATVELSPGAIAPHAFLFGEDASRVVISFPPAFQGEVATRCQAAGVPCAVIGVVGGERLTASGLFDVSLAQLSRAWRSGIPGLMKQPPG